MRLSQIKMAGFKSFVDPTSIHFPSDLVGVVGPNGCGKSNIIDAVRWVMGESSRHLRGDTMEDVIFNGSTGRKPVGQASIELIFDNSDGQAGGQYAHYSEIALRRSVSRDGQSKYFLNGSNCRRRDVVDIFLGTGLGPRSYAIIEQGTISRLIEARPEELRIYLEEAAGISKYKERRRETENRMRHARENISRLDDVREELDKHINHLQRQAKTAQKYQALKAQEREAKASLLALRWRCQARDAAAKEQIVNRQHVRQEQATAELRSLEAEIEKLRERHAEANETLNQVQARYYKFGGDIARTEQAIAHHKALRARQLQDLDQVQYAREAAETEACRDRDHLTQLARDIAAAEPALEFAQCELSDHTAELANAEQAMAEWQAESEALTHQVAGPEQTAQVERARIEHLDRTLAQLNARQTRLSEEERQLSSDLLEAEIEQLRSQATHAEQQVTERQQQLNGALDAIGARRKQDQILSQQLDETRKRLQQTDGRLGALEVLQEAALGKHEQAVVHWLAHNGFASAPRLAEQLEVTAGWERALETVLGPTLEAVCVESPETALPALEALPQGRLQLIDTGEGGTIPLASHERMNATLSSKVDAPPAIADMLSRVYVVEDLPQALSMREKLAAGESVVTADGIWIGRGWLSVAREADEQGGVLAREAKIKKLREEAIILNHNVDEAQTELARGQALLQGLEQSREQLQAENNQAHRMRAEIETRLGQSQQKLEQMAARKTQLIDELRDVQTHLAGDDAERQCCLERRDQAIVAVAVLRDQRQLLVARRPDLQRALESAHAAVRERREQTHKLALRLEAIRTACGSTQQSLTRAQAQLDQFEQRQHELEATIELGAEPLAALEQSLAGLLQQRLEIERDLTMARTNLQDIENSLRERDELRLKTQHDCEVLRAELDTARMAWQGASIRCQTLKEQFDQTGLKLESLIDELGANAADGSTFEQWEVQVENLKLSIDRLGAINLAAIDEFREQCERKAYLDRQHADLSEALETLENAIHKIDHETRHRFKEIFECVNARLQAMFPRLFGGGQAHLEMTENDWLTTGIALMARPPGKRLSTIHLMSGGEKALTAVALVFAIFELNPAPFCLLDEVDAPLDDANVGRFCELVKEMSRQVQFIFITHNKTTMEYAEQLIGVTMFEPGVSRLVAVDVDEAAQMATG